MAYMTCKVYTPIAGGCDGQSTNHADGVPLRAMQTRVGAPEFSAEAEGVPEVQESLLGQTQAGY